MLIIWKFQFLCVRLKYEKRFKKKYFENDLYFGSGQFFSRQKWCCGDRYHLVSNNENHCCQQRENKNYQQCVCHCSNVNWVEKGPKYPLLLETMHGAITAVFTTSIKDWQAFWLSIKNECWPKFLMQKNDMNCMGSRILRHPNVYVPVHTKLDIKLIKSMSSYVLKTPFKSESSFKGRI